MHITPVSFEFVSAYNIKKASFTQIISKLRSEGQDIVYDPEIGYYIREKRPYPLFIKIEKKEKNYYIGKLFNIYPCILHTNKKLKEKTTANIKGTIEKIEDGIIHVKDSEN